MHRCIQYFSPAVAKNPYDIEDKPMEVDEEEGGEENNEGMTQDQPDNQAEDAGEEQKAEDETDGEQRDGDKDSETEERGEREGDEDEEEEKEKGDEKGREEDMTVPADEGQKPKVSSHFAINDFYSSNSDTFSSLRSIFVCIRMRSWMVRKMMPRWSLWRERSTRQTGRRPRRTFRATRRWSWQEPRPKETRPKR